MCAEMTGPRSPHLQHVAGAESVKTKVPGQKPMILIYSPDMNFCFSLSSFFQDRYDVITTTDPDLLESLAAIRSASLVMIDAEPSRRLIERLRELRRVNDSLPLMMLYVYGPGGGELDRTIRDHVNVVLYKPLNINEISRSIEELIGA